MTWKLEGVPPIAGHWPLKVRCGGDGCRKRHWWVILRIRMAPSFRYQVVRIVEDHRPDPSSQREVLESVPELNEEIIDLALMVLHTEPEEPKTA